MPNWKKLVTSGSDAHLNSITVASNVTANGFIGNLTGTASYATNVGEVFGYQHQQSTPTGSWIINHGLNTSTPIVQVYNNDNKVIIPNEIESVTPNQTKVFFDYNQNGYAIISKGLGTTNVSVDSASYAVFSDVATTAINSNTALNATSASYTTYAQTSTTSQTASYVVQAQTASYFITSSVGTASFVATSSWSNNSRTASYVETAQTASYFITSSVSTASFVQTAQTASYVQSVVSSSYALTASYALNGGGGTTTGGTSVTISGSRPTLQSSGSLWWNSNDGNLYIQTLAPTGSTWVPATNTVAGGEGGATLVRTFTNVTSITINHGLNTTSPIIQLYSASKQFVPQDIEIIDQNTSKITFSGLTTGTVVISTGITNNFNNITGGTTVTQVFTGSTVTFNHNLGTRTPIVQVYDSSSNQIIPSYVSASTINQVQLGFYQSTMGTVVASTGVTNSDVAYAQTASVATTAVSSSYLIGNTPTYLMAGNGSSQSIPNATVTIITNWTNQTTINTGEWNATTGTFTATKAGIYLVTSFLTFSSATDNIGNEFGVSVYKNSSGFSNQRQFTENTGNTFKQSGTATAILQLSVGDTITIRAYQNSGASRTLHTNGNTVTIQELPSNITR